MRNKLPSGTFHCVAGCVGTAGAGSRGDSVRTLHRTRLGTFWNSIFPAAGWEGRSWNGTVPVLLEYEIEATRKASWLSTWIVTASEWKLGFPFRMEYLLKDKVSEVSTDSTISTRGVQLNKVHTPQTHS